MQSTTKLFSIFIFDHQAACFQLHNHQWRIEPIRGESWSSISESGFDLAALLANLNQRLNLAANFADVELNLIYNQAAVSDLKNLPESLAALGCNRWQLLRWEPLAARCTVSTTPCDRFDLTWLINSVLPILQNTFNYADEAFNAEQHRVLRDHEQTLESLSLETQRLRQDKTALQAQIEALQLVDIEQLLVFLPAIYRNFWGVINPSDLALIAGSLKVPNIPSPQIEPSADTVKALRKKLLNLPLRERHQLLSFCRQLPHNLQVRSEMRDLLEETL
jgi:hypothetical protein